MSDRVRTKKCSHTRKSRGSEEISLLCVISGGVVSKFGGRNILLLLRCIYISTLNVIVIRNVPFNDVSCLGKKWKRSSEQSRYSPFGS